jgi:hypothetical protein
LPLTTPTKVVTTLVRTLTQKPDAVMICRVAVVNTSPLRRLDLHEGQSADDVRNYYGWDGDHYLGERNGR